MRIHNWGASAKYHCLHPALNHCAIQKLVSIDIFLDIWMVFVRRTGTVENKKCLKIFRKISKNFEKIEKIEKLLCDWEILPSQNFHQFENFVSRKCSGCFWLEMLPFLGSVTKIFFADFFISISNHSFFSKKQEKNFGWKCYHYVTTWKTEKWAFLKVQLTMENISQ